LSFLVISCPCALVISVPLGYFGGIGAASKRGILVKGSNYLDALGEADSIIFDKTGTLTKGSFSVSKVVPALSGEGVRFGTQAAAVSESALIEMAAIAEAYSDHPIAVSVRRAALERGIYPASVSPDAYREMAGRGVSVAAQGKEILVGNKKLMDESGITDVPQVKTAGTLLFVASDHKFAGYIEIEDEIKPEAASVIEELRNLHIAHIGLLTGDHAASAKKTAEVLGITDVYSELLPSQKLEKMEEIISLRKSAAPPKGTLVYVGDGINDAPVLVRADIGVAIGAMASGAAIEAADIVIMSDDLTALGKAIRIARKTKRIVMENIIFALSVKGLILILAALGLTNLWFAIFADVGVAVIAILNSVRAGR
jgi:Cd2+/Zn2+-exporting ATPase